MNKKTVMKSFRFYPSLAQSVSCEARHRDISEAEFVRKIIEESLKNDRKYTASLLGKKPHEFFYSQKMVSQN